MEWISENDKYKFVFEKVNNIFYNSADLYDYTINLQIFDFIGRLLLTIKFNKMDAIRILNCLFKFNNEMGGYGDSYTIKFNFSSELNQLIHYIYIEYVPINYNEYEIDIYPKDIRFQIKQFNDKMMNNYRDMVRLSTHISSIELTQLCNALYSATLIDINNPAQCKSIIRHSNKFRE